MREEEKRKEKGKKERQRGERKCGIKKLRNSGEMTIKRKEKRE